MEIENRYRDLHAHPELGMSEHRTAAVVAALAWLGPGDDTGNPPPGTGQLRHDMGRSAT